jgi:hypothetical protein
VVALLRDLKTATIRSLRLIAGVADLVADAWAPLETPPVSLTDEVPEIKTAVEEVNLPRVQFGLRLPNGEIVWDTELYQNRGLATTEQRAALLVALRQTAVDLSFPEQDFLGFYGWARRLCWPRTGEVGEEVDVVPMFAPDPVSLGSTNGNVESPLPT